jgi:hypothetical protein
MLWLGAVLGLRWSEVAGLRVGRLDLDAGRISVAEALVRGTGGRNVFGPPKSTLGTRTMFMPQTIVDMLSAHLERSGFTKDDTDALVFTDDDGGSLRYSNWRRRFWLPAVAPADCAGAGFHDLRRFECHHSGRRGRRRENGADPGSAMPTRGQRWPSTHRRRRQSTGRSGRHRRTLLWSQGQKDSGTKVPRHFRAIGSGGSGSLRSLSL